MASPPLRCTALTGGVQLVLQGVQHKGEGAEEGDEGEDAGVEQLLCVHHVGQLRGGGRGSTRVSMECASSVQEHGCVQAHVDMAHNVGAAPGWRGGQAAGRWGLAHMAPPGAAPPRASAGACAAVSRACWRCCRRTLVYSTVKPMAMGRLTQVLRKGMISAPEPGAVTTSTSCAHAAGRWGGRLWVGGRNRRGRCSASRACWRASRCQG